MKKVLCFSMLVLALLSSCNTLYIQTLNIKSADGNSSDVCKYSDGNVTIYYDFWAENGNPGFVIENNTDQIIYVDMAKSFYVSGNTAKDYYLNRTFSASNSSGEAVSKNVSATAYGIWQPSGYLGSLSKSFSKSAAINSSKGVSFEEKPVIAIPSHCQKTVCEYNILSSPLQDCSVKMFPGSNGEEFKFKEGQMPEFSNVITYKVGESGTDKTVTNKFYITGFTNMKQSKAINKEKIGCKETKTIKTYKNRRPDSFYIIYDNSYPNRYSADAKKETN